jgi:hypothetical protein
MLKENIQHPMLNIELEHTGKMPVPLCIAFDSQLRLRGFVLMVGLCARRDISKPLRFGKWLIRPPWFSTGVVYEKFAIVGPRFDAPSIHPNLHRARGRDAAVALGAG